MLTANLSLLRRLDLDLLHLDLTLYQLTDCKLAYSKFAVKNILPSMFTYSSTESGIFNTVKLDE
jgi:hypothetical protein